MAARKLSSRCLLLPCIGFLRKTRKQDFCRDVVDGGRPRLIPPTYTPTPSAQQDDAYGNFMYFIRIIERRSEAEKQAYQQGYYISVSSTNRSMKWHVRCGGAVGRMLIKRCVILIVARAVGGGRHMASCCSRARRQYHTYSCRSFIQVYSRVVAVNYCLA